MSLLKNSSDEINSDINKSDLQISSNEMCRHMEDLQI